MGKDQDPIVVGYKYFIGMHLALCHIADALCKIRVDQSIIYDAVVEENKQIYLDAPTLYGESEGGVSGNCDIAFGRFNQPRNDYLQSQLGSGCPAFRGVTAVVARRVYIGNTPYMKPWAFYVERTQTESGWYAEKAAIPRS